MNALRARSCDAGGRAAFTRDHAAMLIALIVLSAGLAAAAPRVVLSIEAQPLAGALKSVAEIFDLQILFFPEDVSGIQAPALDGEYTADEAFTLLLEGTVLEHRFIDETSVTISRRKRSELDATAPHGGRGGPELGPGMGGAGTAAPGRDSRSVAVDRSQPAGDESRSAAGDVFVGELVVTAQKREQELQEVPFSIQAFEGAVLERSSIRDLSELISFVPGASQDISYGAGQRVFQLRGVAAGAGDPTVGYYVDDTAFFGVGQGLAPMGLTFDVERVEVLRGPQGTLYGNGSMGGTVRYITRAPDLSSLEGSLRAGYSRTAGGDPGDYVEAAVSVPIVREKLGLRLVASSEDVGGYTDVPSQGLQNTNPAALEHARASLLWVPTERMTLRFQYSSSNAKQDGSLLLSSRDPPISVHEPTDYYRWEYDLISGTLQYSFDVATLTSTTSSIDGSWHVLNHIPAPLAPNGVLEFDYDTPTRTINNETRLSSLGGSPWQWVAGVFYSDSEVRRFTQTNAPDLLPSSESLVTAESISVFGELSWELLGGRLVPLLGLRTFQDERTAVSTSLDEPLGPYTFADTAPRFSLSYLPTSGATYYLNIAKGFRSGSFNTPGVCDVLAQLGPLPCRLTVPSDELWSYELGVKRALASGRVFMDGALYYQDWRGNRQSVAYSGVSAAYQVGDAAIPGVDLGVSYSPARWRGLLVQLNANWNDAHFTTIDPAISEATGVEAGDRLPVVPDWTASVAASYERAISSSWSVLASIGYSHIAPQLGQFGSHATGDRRDLLRARLGLGIGRLGVSLFAKNLLNEQGAISAENPIDGIPVVTQDYPRQVGLELTYDF